ncbi:MAG: hypothetical protein L0221_10025 [Chloroflexi bacterium]|nr:hypothetical protein [Chloroflexota bacterium]
MTEPRRDLRQPNVLNLESRIRALEERAIADDGLHTNLVRADSATAASVDKLTTALNDPRTGLIVELASFRNEVRTDREVFRGQIRLATIVVSAVFAIVSVVAPWIQSLVSSVFRVTAP